MEVLLTLLGALAVFALVFCGALVLAGVIAFVVYRRFQGAGGAPIQSDDDEIARAEAFLANAELQPWTPDAFRDLSCRWVGWWRGITQPGGGRGYYEGIVRSFSQPDAPGWVAFTVRRWRMRDAEVHLRTSDQHITLNLTSDGPTRPNGRADVHVDGQPVGAIDIQFPICHIRSSDGAITGQMRKRSASLRDQYYAPIEINGRPIAGLTEIWIRQPAAIRQPHRAFDGLAASLNPAEQTWLLVYLALALYYDSLWKRRSD